MSRKKIRIVIVDDHPVVRESWKVFIDREPGMEYLAGYSTGPDALTRLDELRPDVMMVDVQMKPMDGIALTRSITNRWPEIRIIGTSLNNHPNYAHKMIEAGASGFVTKDSPLHEIALAIREVHDGQIYICEEVRNRMD